MSSSGPRRRTGPRVQPGCIADVARPARSIPSSRYSPSPDRMPNDSRYFANTAENQLPRQPSTRSPPRRRKRHPWPRWPKDGRRERSASRDIVVFSGESSYLLANLPGPDRCSGRSVANHCLGARPWAQARDQCRSFGGALECTCLCQRVTGLAIPPCDLDKSRTRRRGRERCLLTRLGCAGPQLPVLGLGRCPLPKLCCLDEVLSCT